MASDLKHAMDLVGRIEAEGEAAKSDELIGAARKLLNELLGEQEKGGGGGGGEGKPGEEEGEGEGGGGGEGEGEPKPGKGKGSGKGKPSKGGEPGEGEGEGEPGEGEPGEGEGSLGDALDKLKDDTDAREKEAAEKARKMRGAKPGDSTEAKDAEERILLRRARRSERQLTGPDIRGVLDTDEIAMGSGVGKGAGQLLESAADHDAYLKLVGSVSGQVAESARQLREIMLPTQKTLKYQRSGRFMANRSSQFYTMSQSKPVEEMFTVTRMLFDKEVPAVAIVVDVSGSFAAQNPAAHLTHLLEALRFSFPPNKVGAYVFGSNWVIVKGFNEQWNGADRTAPAIRDAGGGTVPEPALTRALMDISTVPARHKLLVIISDFQFGGGADTSNLLLKAKHAGIQTIAIADAGEYDTTGQSAKQSATYSLPGRHAFFIVHGLKEVVPSLLAYLRNFYRGTPTPGAWWTPDRAGAPCTQTPSARRP